MDMLTPEQLQGMLPDITLILITTVLSSLFSIGIYILTSYSMYCIADRRLIRHAWLAWIPVGNLWILGSIADHYRLQAKGQIKARRKVLLGTSIGAAVACVAMFILCIVMAVKLFAITDPITGELTGDVMATAGSVLIGVVVLYLVMVVLIIWHLVFQYIAYYELFASCVPRNAVVYLVLSIVIPITLPVFLVACRNKDLGLIFRCPTPVAPPAEPWQQTGQ